MFRNYLPQDIQPQQILIVGDDFGHSGLDRKLIILGARVYSVGAKHNLPEGVIFYGEGGDHGWQRTLHLLINRIKHDFAGAAKGKGMLSPDKHMDINEIINSAQREQRGILIWGDASGWQVDHAKYAQDIAWSINSLKRYSSVKIPGLGRVDIPEILSESSIVLILPRANSPPGLLVNNENAYQIAHNGLSRNSIYIDEYIYSQLYTFEIAVLLAHEAILLGAKKLAAQRGMPWTEQLAKDVSNIAEEYEIQIVGRSSTGRGSNFDNRIEELLGFNNQAQQVPREYTHDEPVQLSEEPIIEPVTPPKPQVREEINSSRITPQPKMEERQRPASSRTVTLDFAETHNAALDSLRKLFSDSLSKDTSVGLPTTIGSFPPPMAEELRQSYYLHKVSRMPLDADFLAILTAFFARTFPNHANELILYLRDLSVYVIDNQESTFGATLSGNIFYVQRSCMEDLLNRPITVAQIYQGIKTKDREISIALFRIFIHEIGSAFFKLSHPGNQDLERLFLALLSKSTVTLSQTTETEVRTINNTVDLDSLARIDWANKRSKMGDGMQDKVRFDSNTASSFLKGVNARLINSLYSPNQTIRNNAAKALVRFKAIEALPYLELLAEKEPDNKVITDALSELETAWETTNSEKVTIKTADAFAKVLLTVDETGELALNENTIQAINTLYNAYNGLTLEVDIDTLIDTSTGVPKLKGLGFKEALASLYKAQQKKEIPTNLKIRLINIDSSLNRDKIIKVLGLSDDLLNSMVSIPNIPEDYLVKGLEPYLIQGSVRIIFEDNLKYWGKKVDVLVKRGKETETLSSIGLIVASLAKEPKFYDSLPKDIKEYIVAKTNGKGKVELDDEGKIKQLIFKPIEKTKVDTQYLDRLDKANKELDGMV